ncbi:MAG: ABC transporter ATP-binding protein [Chloroflexi bacterium]|nr:ABC transporter ATP-binding protein [Chloroflexota bacterium]MDA1146730.1 ABC transporter ATP-binding protein [Chloroflexota bacterium]
MSSSPDAPVEAPAARPADTPEELPPALPAMWRMFVLGLREQPTLLFVSFALTLVASLPAVLGPFWMRMLSDGAVDGDRRLIEIAAVGLAVAAVGTWFLRTLSDRIQRRFRDRMTIALERHVAGLQSNAATIELHERPEYLDRLEVLRNQVFVLDHLYMSIFMTTGWLFQLLLLVALLTTVHPALVLLLVAAIPTFYASGWRAAVERDAEEASASDSRFSRHIFETATDVSASKEIRVMGAGARLVERREDAWQRWYDTVSAARWGSAVWYSLGWAIFAGSFIAAAVFVSAGINGTPGEVVLVLSSGILLASYIGAAVGEIGFLRGIWLDGARRLVWLERYVEAKQSIGDVPAPDTLTEGIRLRDVSFAYPGTDRLVLDHVDLELPAGAVVAIVGENGAGKTTLVKLLARMYEPTSGRIEIDGHDLSRMSAEEWRERLAGAFQDFFRFEFLAHETVGLGDVPRIEDRVAVGAAVGRAGADDVVSRLREGLDTQLGPTWPGGVEMSFGQWQRLALARGFMRDDPLLLILDEPTAALDAETEHALFERYASAARGGHSDAANGRITLLVSHRFSTVRMADLIVVMDGAHVVEVGTHSALVARGGKYAELYEIQAASYR